MFYLHKLSRLLPSCLLLFLASPKLGGIILTVAQKNQQIFSTQKKFRFRFSPKLLGKFTFQNGFHFKNEQGCEKITLPKFNGGTDTTISKRRNGTKLILITYMYTAVWTMAKTGFLGPEYSSNHGLLFRDLTSSILVLFLSIAFVKSVTYLSQKGIIESRDSRKLIHTLSAPLFIICWPLFSNVPTVRFVVAPILFIQLMSLVFSAKSTGDGAALASAVSRSGDVSEALAGPLFYILVVTASTLTFWTENLLGVIPITVLSLGDGLADIVGRRLGKNNKWFFNPDKSMAGTLAFVIGSMLGCISLCSWLGFTGTIELPFDTMELSGRIFLISTLCAMVEIIPRLQDNFSVPFAATMLSYLFLKSPVDA